MNKIKNGLIHIYTGNGKGKTTSALGLSLRAIGHGKKVCFIQFMKGYEYGETLVKVKNLKIKQFGRKNFVDKKNKKDIELAKEGLEFAKKVIKSKKYDLVVLDEINVAVNFNLIPLEDVINLIKNKPKETEIILTGRYAKKELIELADYVSEIKEVKHPYQRGIKARKGIEF